MIRRRALLLSAFGLLFLSGCATLGAVSAWLNGAVAFTPSQLQHYMDRRFPRDFDKLGGLVTVTLSRPRVSVPPGERRLRLDFDMGIGALGSRGGDSGHLALASGLRYDPATRGLHLADPELLQFDLPGAGTLLGGGARGIVNSLLAEYARSEPVYTLDDNLLRKLPPGRRIGDVTVGGGVVTVHLDD